MHGSSQPHVALLFHAKDRGRDLRRYAITHLAEMWRADGLRVTPVFGTRRQASADLAILHVDLSVVPAEYLDFAQRYPIVLNAAIRDVRKSTLSPHIVAIDDDYDGPVIVKTDLNCGGHMERAHRSTLSRWIGGISHAVRGRRLAPIRNKREYRVYERSQEVPQSTWAHPALIVERFLPERTEAGYAVRNCCLLGSRTKTDWMESPDPIVSDASASDFRSIETDPEIPRVCESVRLDYGKIDYTIHEGRVVVLDVNKTVGASVADKNPNITAHRRVWAPGIHDFLEGRRTPL